MYDKQLYLYGAFDFLESSASLRGTLSVLLDPQSVLGFPRIGLDFRVRMRRSVHQSDSVATSLLGGPTCDDVLPLLLDFIVDFDRDRDGVDDHPKGFASPRGSQ